MELPRLNAGAGVDTTKKPAGRFRMRITTWTEVSRAAKARLLARLNRDRFLETGQGCILNLTTVVTSRQP